MSALILFSSSSLEFFRRVQMIVCSMRERLRHVDMFSLLVLSFFLICDVRNVCTGLSWLALATATLIFGNFVHRRYNSLR